ncbi:hypothetical protein ACFV19_32115 [Streptomyces griseoluteus]|uniref:hypothetical protein n=1 Tax=Streptomyces griseoluteus TaxID=29306 RepID=UPI00367718A5
MGLIVLLLGAGDALADSLVAATFTNPGDAVDRIVTVLIPDGVSNSITLFSESQNDRAVRHGGDSHEHGDADGGIQERDVGADAADSQQRGSSGVEAVHQGQPLAARIEQMLGGSSMSPRSLPGAGDRAEEVAAPSGRLASKRTGMGRSPSRYWRDKARASVTECNRGKPH